MTAQEFVASEVDEAMTLQALMDEVIEPDNTHESSKARAERIADAISRKDLDELDALQEKMSGLIDKIMANTFDPDDPDECDEKELERLLIEAEDHKDLKRLVDVRYQMIRTRIFNHITAANKAKGISDPEYAPGEAPVPNLGKKFTREGGRIVALLDHAKLRKRLGEKRWKQVCEAEVVPAVAEHVEYHLMEDKILELVRKDPKVLEVFRECVSTGKRTPRSFHVRKL